MEDQQRPSSGGFPRDLVLSLAAPLLKGWPEPFDLTPSGAGLAERHGDFMQVAVALQESGWIMYESLLVGTGAEPRAVNACMTAKGRVHLLELGSPEHGG
jgi:hypothetical protein